MEINTAIIRHGNKSPEAIVHMGTCNNMQSKPVSVLMSESG